jgi:hypothetical protein
MLVRIYRLRKEVEAFCEDEVRVTCLNATQWRQVEYLIQILYPFCVYTSSIGRTVNGPTIQNVFPVYDKLFGHLDMQIAKLENKRLAWKKKLKRALEMGRAHLELYYGKTKDALGDIYGVTTILAPEYKLSLFDNPDWKEDDNENWVSRHLLQ